jgi:high-affinity iron transporter
MGQMLVATLREGIEAFLIVAIAATYLARTGRAALLPAVWWGAGAALAASLVLGVLLAEWAVVPLHEGILALVAAALVLSMVAFMLKAARRMRADIGAKLEAAAAKPGTGAWIGVFAFTLLMITREGMEMAFITAALSKNEGSGALLAGAFAGIALAALLAWGWLRYGQRVNLALFFQATSIFLVLFAVQLLFYAFHEFTEANAIPGIDNAYWHVATEDWAEGTVAELVSAALVVVPLAWIGWSLLIRWRTAS